MRRSEDMGIKLYDISEWCRKGSDPENYTYLGEIDKDVSIGNVINVEGNYFAVGVLSFQNKSAGVHPVKINFRPNGAEYERNIICPYCGYEDVNSWEREESDERHECGRCGAIMSYERIVTVEYNSYPVKSPNTVKAKWL
jgi:hypothetical protein